MAGTKAGGLKTAQTNKEKYGADYYKQLGQKGGSTPTNKPKGFAVDDRTLIEKLLGKPSRARIAGLKGGRKSRR